MQLMEMGLLSTLELLKAYGAVIEELRRRDIVRSANNPVSDLAELLFCQTFECVRERNSAAGYDATDPSGLRIQIKARQLATPKGSRQLSAIRNLPADPFDQLAGILFDRNFAIIRAAVIPISIVKMRARRSDHTNSWKFILADDVWSEPGVLDATAELSRAASALGEDRK